MLDIKLVRANPELVKENMKKKFQEEKLPLVDEVLELDGQFRASKARGDELRQQRNAVSKGCHNRHTHAKLFHFYFKNPHTAQFVLKSIQIFVFHGV